MKACDSRSVHHMFQPEAGPQTGKETATMSPPRKWAESRAAAVYMIIAGLGLVGAGVWFIADNAMFLSKAAHVAGTVISLEKVRGAKGTPLYYPMVRYQRAGVGEPEMFRSRPGLWPSPFAVGDKVTVAYARGDPASARVVSFWTLWFLPACMIVFGAGSMYAGRSTLTTQRRGQTRDWHD